MSRAAEWLHRYCRACGFDIRLVRNMDRALRELEEQRRREYLSRLATLRSQTAAKDFPASNQSAGGSGVRVAWVGARDFEKAVCARIREAGVVLDIGCGIRPQPYVKARIHICCEPCAEYLHRLMIETQGSDLHVYINGGLEQAAELLPPGSVDAVFLLEVLEHLPKAQARECLRKVVALARSQVVVSTPLGFLPQHNPSGPADPWGMGGAEWQKHRSAWDLEDFPAAEGWEIVACRDFHKQDAYGAALAKPVGAMTAFYDAPAVGKESGA